MQCVYFCSEVCGSFPWAAFGLGAEPSSCRIAALHRGAGPRTRRKISAFDPTVVCKALWSAMFSPFARGNQTSFPDLVWYLVNGPDFSVSLKPWWDTCPQPPLDQSLGSDVPKAAAPGFHCIENKSQTLPQVCTAVCGDATKATQRGPVSACHTPKYSVLLLGRWESSNEFFLYQAINIIYRRSERISIVVLTANLVAASNEELFGRGR